MNNITIKQSVKEFSEKMMKEIKVDIDIEYCKKNNIKFKDNEIDSSTVELFNTKSTKAAFDLVTRDRKN